MSKLVFALGVVILLMGASIGLFPAWFLGLANWESQEGRYIAVSSRLIAGLILILGASGSRYPLGLKVFGTAVFLAGLMLLFLPLNLWIGLFNWFATGHPPLFRVGAGVGGTLLGLFLVHASRPKKSPA